MLCTMTPYSLTLQQAFSKITPPLLGRASPQDGNTFAVDFNLTESTQQNQPITKALFQRLTQCWEPSAELPDSISPYISGHELHTQFIANPTDSSQVLKLMRTQWGYILQARNLSHSTFMEGYGATGLCHTEGEFTTNLRQFSASWQFGSNSFSAVMPASKGSVGSIYVPRFAGEG